MGLNVEVETLVHLKGKLNDLLKREKITSEAVRLAIFLSDVILGIEWLSSVTMTDWAYKAELRAYAAKKLLKKSLKDLPTLKKDLAREDFELLESALKKIKNCLD